MQSQNADGLCNGGCWRGRSCLRGLTGQVYGFLLPLHNLALLRLRYLGRYWHVPIFMGDRKPLDLERLRRYLLPFWLRHFVLHQPDHSLGASRPGFHLAVSVCYALGGFLLLRSLLQRRGSLRTILRKKKTATSQRRNTAGPDQAPVFGRRFRITDCVCYLPQ